MAGETQITVIGNLVADPELRFTPSGSAVANFTLASTPRTFNRTTNEWEDGETLFLRSSVWREAAENVAETLTKGMRVIAEGRLKSRSYETKEGEKRTVIEFEIDEIGPSLRYANAKVNRVQRGQGQGQQGGGFGGGQPQQGPNSQWGNGQGNPQGGFGGGWSQPAAQQQAQAQGGWGQQPAQQPQQAPAQQYAQAAAAGPQQPAQQYAAAPQQAAPQQGYAGIDPAQAAQGQDPWAAPGGQGGWGGNANGEPPF